MNPPRRRGEVFDGELSMSETCAECGAKCCRYFCFEIDEPTDYAGFEDVRWFLLHHDVSVHIDEGDWYISIGNRCKMLGLDNRCQGYDTRPNTFSFKQIRALTAPIGSLRAAVLSRVHSDSSRVEFAKHQY